ncbi:MAG: zinc-ribbon domain-containing protein, partial [Betaproteobacteria bacterium]|nr:zinc-ribbon domain-containing protein [Betaproteobacteria bacterium]MBV9360143.1 zinc-ribbon domain-containing protein [Betaproteobacteria bacterium]
MSLTTRCPVCGTTFRVHSTQLAAHSGTVRCGKCGGVFNGVAALVEEGEERLALEPSPQLGLFDPGRRQPEAVADPNAPLPDFLADDPASRRARWLWMGAAFLAASV